MAAGRPTKFEDRFIEIAEMVLSSGRSMTQLARDLNISKSTLYKWGDENPIFSDALDIGREHSQAHWEDKLEDMMYSKEVNAPLVKLYFANRFKWHDRPEAEEIDIKPKELNISFEVRDPVASVKVTNAKPE